MDEQRCLAEAYIIGLEQQIQVLEADSQTKDLKISELQQAAAAASEGEEDEEQARLLAAAKGRVAALEERIRVLEIESQEKEMEIQALLKSADMRTASGIDAGKQDEPIPDVAEEPQAVEVEEKQAAAAPMTASMKKRLKKKAKKQSASVSPALTKEEVDEREAPAVQVEIAPVEQQVVVAPSEQQQIESVQTTVEEIPAVVVVAEEPQEVAAAAPIEQQVVLEGTPASTEVASIVDDVKVEEEEQSTSAAPDLAAEMTASMKKRLKKKAKKQGASGSPALPEEEGDNEVVVAPEVETPPVTETAAVATVDEAAAVEQAPITGEATSVLTEQQQEEPVQPAAEEQQENAAQTSPVMEETTEQAADDVKVEQEESTPVVMTASMKKKLKKKAKKQGSSTSPALPEEETTVPMVVEAETPRAIEAEEAHVAMEKKASAPVEEEQVTAPIVEETTASEEVAPVVAEEHKEVTTPVEEAAVAEDDNVASVDEIAAAKQVDEEIVAPPAEEQEVKEEIVPTIETDAPEQNVETIAPEQAPEVEAIIPEQEAKVEAVVPEQIIQEATATLPKLQWSSLEEEAVLTAPVSVRKGDSIPFKLNDTAPNGGNDVVEEKKNRRRGNRSAKSVIDTAIAAAEPKKQPARKAKHSDSAAAPIIAAVEALVSSPPRPESAKSPAAAKMTTPQKTPGRTNNNRTVPASPFDTLKKPPPGFAALPPLRGVVLVLESGISPITGFGYAVLNVSLSRRSQYNIQDVTSGKLLLEMEREGTDFPRCRLENLLCGYEYTLQVYESKGKKRMLPEATATVEIPLVAPPLPPDNLQVCDRQRTAVKIRFTPPQADGGSPFTHYEYELDRDATTTQVIQKPELVVKNLLSGSKHQVRVRACNAQGHGSYSQPLLFTTSEAPPTAPRNIQLVSESGSSMVIKLDAPERDNGAEITSYEIQIKRSSDSDFSVAFNSLPSSSTLMEFPLTQLQEHTTYVLRARAQNREGQSTWSDSVQVDTTAALPAQLAAPTIVTNNNGFTVMWEEKLGCTYLLEARRDAATARWTTVVDNSDNAQFAWFPNSNASEVLFPGVRYAFRVTAQNARGRGRESPASEMIKIGAVAPLPPKHAPRIVSCNAQQRTMRIQFDLSENSGGSQQVSSVIALRRVGNSAAAAAAAVKKETPPAVRVFTSQADYEKVYSAKQEEIQSKYAVGELVDAVYEDGKFYRGSIVQVCGAQEYQVEFVGYGNTERVAEANIRTTFSVGQEVLAEVYETTAGAESLPLQGKVLGEVVSVVNEGYWIAFKAHALGRQQTHAFDVYASSSAAAAPPVPSRKASPAAAAAAAVQSTHPLPGARVASPREWVEVGETADLGFVLQGLEPGAQYEVMIACKSEDGGRGAFGESFALQMAPSVPLAPLAPPEVSLHKNTNKLILKLSNTLNDQGSPVTGCALQWACCQVNRNGEAAVTVSPIATQQVLLHEMDSLTFVPDRELGSMNFVFRHRLRNKVGNGEYSEWTLVRDLPVLPPSAVQQVRLALNKKNTALQVTYSAPEKTNGSVVQHYRVRYRAVPQMEWIDDMQETKLEATITSLKRGVTYEVRVQAVNAAGAGPFSSVESIRVPGTAPQAKCTNVTIKVKSHREFEAQWDFDYEAHGGGESVSFEVEYLLKTSDVAPPNKLLSVRGEVAVCNTRTFVRNSKTTLRPSSSYWFRVMAFNKMGSSPFTEWQLFTMHAAPIVVATKPPKQVDHVALVQEAAVAENIAMKRCTVSASGQVELEITFSATSNMEVVHAVEITDEHKKPRTFTNIKLHQQGVLVLPCHHHLKPSARYSLRIQLAAAHAFSKPVVFEVPAIPVEAPPVEQAVVRPFPVKRGPPAAQLKLRRAIKSHFGFITLAFTLLVLFAASEYTLFTVGAVGLAALTAMLQLRLTTVEPVAAAAAAAQRKRKPPIVAAPIKPESLVSLHHLAAKLNGLALCFAVLLLVWFVGEAELGVGRFYFAHVVSIVALLVYYIVPSTSSA